MAIDQEKEMQQDAAEEQIENTQQAEPEVDETPEAQQDEKAIYEKELEELKDKYIRLVAEFDNYRRRSARERGELIATAGKDIITALLPVLDDTERAEKQMENEQSVDHLKEGVALIFAKLKQTLQQKGLRKMESKGTEFDADLHEAIAEIPVQHEDEKGKIVDEVTSGYYLGDKIIRHAKVVVGK